MKPREWYPVDKIGGHIIAHDDNDDTCFEGVLVTQRKTAVKCSDRTRSYTLTEAARFQDGLKFGIFSTQSMVTWALREAEAKSQIVVLHIIQRGAGRFEVLQVDAYSFHEFDRSEEEIEEVEYIGHRLHNFEVRVISIGVRTVDVRY